MFTRSGQVVINPDVPVGLPEFASLYDSPDASHTIFQQFPTEAKSYLDDQWHKTGIQDSPEEYFRRRKLMPQTVDNVQGPVIPQNVVMPAAAPSAQPFATVANGSSYFGQPVQDPRAVTNQRMMSASTVPLPRPGMNGQDLLAAQVAGDSGDVKRFLLKQQGVKYEDYLNKPVQDGIISPSALGIPATYYRPDLKPYSPNTGTGVFDHTESPTRLDMNIYNDKDFQELLSSDPQRAEFMYQHLTGRSLLGKGGDYHEAIASRDDQLKAGASYAETALKNGATYDPTTKKFNVWNDEIPPDNGLNVGGSIRPVRVREQATPVQQRWLEQHFQEKSGMPLPRLENFVGQPINTHIGEAALASHPMMQNPAVTSDIALRKARLGRELLATEKLHIADEYAMKTPATESWFGSVLSKNESALRSILGVTGEAQGNVLEDFARQHPSIIDNPSMRGITQFDPGTSMF